MAARLRALNDYERYSAPSRKAQYVFFRKNDGLQDQSVLYIQKGFDGTPEVLIDPNAWGTKTSPVPLTTFSPSKDAKYAVYGKSPSGSDWQEYHVMELATKKTLDDTLQWVKVSSVAWAGDGFFYSRYPAPDQAKAKAGINENHQVFFHKVGTPQSQDQLVYSDPANPQRFHIVDTTDDERFAILSISERGKGKDGNALFVRDLGAGEQGVQAADRRDHQRQLLRRRQRRRQAARGHQQGGAEHAGRPDRSEAAGRGELEGRAARAARAAATASARPAASSSRPTSRM